MLKFIQYIKSKILTFLNKTQQTTPLKSVTKGINWDLYFIEVIKKDPAYGNRLLKAAIAEKERTGDSGKLNKILYYLKEAKK